MPAVSTGANLGVPPPLMVTGLRFPSPYLVPTASALTTTATRLYYGLTYIAETRSIAGAATYNQGAGDNGETYRVGLYTHSATNGPTTLVKDFGEVTLSAAAAERAQSNSVSITAPGYYWLAFHANQDAAMYRMHSGGFVETLAGFSPIFLTSAFTGFYTVPIAAPAAGIIRYVDTAYGALASTAVAPTAVTNSMPTTTLIA